MLGSKHWRVVNTRLAFVSAGSAHFVSNGSNPLFDPGDQAAGGTDTPDMGPSQSLFSIAEEDSSIDTASTASRTLTANPTHLARLNDMASGFQIVASVDTGLGASGAADAFLAAEQRTAAAGRLSRNTASAAPSRQLSSASSAGFGTHMSGGGSGVIIRQPSTAASATNREPGTVTAPHRFSKQASFVSRATLTRQLRSQGSQQGDLATAVAQRRPSSAATDAVSRPLSSSVATAAKQPSIAVLSVSSRQTSSGFAHAHQFSKQASIASGATVSRPSSGKGKQPSSMATAVADKPASSTGKKAAAAISRPGKRGVATAVAAISRRLSRVSSAIVGRQPSSAVPSPPERDAGAADKVSDSVSIFPMATISGQFSGTGSQPNSAATAGANKQLSRAAQASRQTFGGKAALSGAAPAARRPSPSAAAAPASNASKDIPRQVSLPPSQSSSSSSKPTSKIPSPLQPMRTVAGTPDRPPSTAGMRDSLTPEGGAVTRQPLSSSSSLTAARQRPRSAAMTKPVARRLLAQQASVTRAPPVSNPVSRQESFLPSASCKQCCIALIHIEGPCIETLAVGQIMQHAACARL